MIALHTCIMYITHKVLVWSIEYLVEPPVSMIPPPDNTLFTLQSLWVFLLTMNGYLIMGLYGPTDITISIFDSLFS